MDIWFYVFLAFSGGLLVGLSRQINGRLSLSTSPLESSFWNHAVGFAVLCVIALTIGWSHPQDDLADIPLSAYLGGAVGVIFIASSSWLIARIGAAQTAVLVIAGQMVSSVILDIAMGTAGVAWARTLGVALILVGIFYGSRARD